MHLGGMGFDSSVPGTHYIPVDRFSILRANLDYKLVVKVRVVQSNVQVGNIFVFYLQRVHWRGTIRSPVLLDRIQQLTGQSSRFRGVKKGPHQSVPNENVMRLLPYKRACAAEEGTGEDATQSPAIGAAIRCSGIPNPST